MPYDHIITFEDILLYPRFDDLEPCFLILTFQSENTITHLNEVFGVLGLTSSINL